MLRLKKQTCYPCGMPFSRCLFALTLFVSSALQAQTAPSPDNAALVQAFSYALDDVSTFSVPSAALELDTEALSITATPAPSASSNAGDAAEHRLARSVLGAARVAERREQRRRGIGDDTTGHE